MIASRAHLVSVVSELLRHLRHQGIIRIRLRHQDLEAGQAARQVDGRLPRAVRRKLKIRHCQVICLGVRCFYLQDIQTYSSSFVDIRMINFCCEPHLGRLKGISVRDEDLEPEHAALVGGVPGSHDVGLQPVHLVSLGGPALGTGRGRGPQHPQLFADSCSSGHFSEIKTFCSGAPYHLKKILNYISTKSKFLSCGLLGLCLSLSSIFLGLLLCFPLGRGLLPLLPNDG